MSSTQFRKHLLIEIRHLTTLRKLRLRAFGPFDAISENLKHMIAIRQERLAARGV